jgi:uncharacterized membrane protein SirB2
MDVAKWSRFVEVAARRFLRREVFAGVVIVFLVTFPFSQGVGSWVNKAAFLVLYLLFALWIAEKYRRRMT